MRIKDIQRQNGKWVNQVQVYVEDISAPQDTEHGLCQAIKVVFDQNVPETLNYFFPDTQFAVGTSETGRQWYDIRYKNDYFQCKPADAKKEVDLRDNDGYPDWDAIALGKCRHKHIDKLLERLMPTELLAKPEELEAISKLVEFEAKGTLTE